MLDERAATNKWRQLFRGQPITWLTVSEAESVLKEIHEESPLRFRLSAELSEIRSRLEKDAE